jgi:hypothetical protein
MSESTWKHKLDETLQRLVTTNLAADGTVNCVVTTDQGNQPDVAALMEAQGGTIHCCLEAAPVVVASVPVHAIASIAASEHVVAMEAEHTVSPRTPPTP